MHARVAEGKVVGSSDGYGDAYLRKKWVVAAVFSGILAFRSSSGWCQEGNNLLANPSFEKGFTGWSCWTNQEDNRQGFLVVKEGAVDGQQAAGMKGFSKAATVFALVEPVVHGGTYEFTFQYKSYMVSGKASAEIAFQTTREVTPVLWYRHQDWARSGPLLQKTDGWVSCRLKVTVPQDRAIIKIVPKVNVTQQAAEDFLLIDAASFRLLASAGPVTGQLESSPEKAEQEKIELVWGKAPNIIRNPGFELTDAEHQPLFWSRQIPEEKIRELVKNLGLHQEIPVANGDFEKVDETRAFFSDTRIQKLGRVKFHKDIWKKGVDLKDFREKGYVSAQDVCPAVEERSVHSGRRAFAFQVEKSQAYSWCEVVLDNMFEIESGQDYLLTFWYCRQADQAFSGTVWVKVGSTYLKVPDFRNGKENQWQQHAFHFRVEGSSGKGAIQLWGICKEKAVTGKIIFDDFRLYKLQGVWEKGMAQVVQAGRQGDRALMVKGQAWPFLLASTRLGIDWHKVYRLTAWMKAEKVIGENCLQVRWENYATKFDLKSLAVTPVAAVTGTFDWKPVSVQLVPPPGAQFLTVELNVRSSQGTWLVDDFFLDGFGEFKAEFLMPQAGYDAHGYKDVVVRTKEKLQVSPVVKVQAQSGKVVASREMVYLGTDLWNGHYYGADFSELTTPGTYLAGVAWENNQVVSPPWTIKAGFYRALAREAMKYFFYQRSGCEVPGWHKACHLDDAWVTSFNTAERYEHRNLTGGWFDAADLNKWLDPAGWYLRAICKTYDTLKDNTTDFLKGRLPDMVEEARWGADYLRRSYKGNGEFYFCVKIHDVLTPPDEDTDNIPGNVDDRCANVVLPETCATMGLAAFALTMKRLNQPEAGEFLRLTEDAFTHQTEDANIRKKLKMGPLEKDTTHLTLSALDLYLTTGQAKYLQFARERVSQIARACLAGRYVQPVVPPKGFTEDAKLFYFLAPLEEFALSFPEETAAEECRQALTMVAQHLLKASRLSPLGHTHPLTEPVSASRLFLSVSRSNTYPLACAWHLAACARILKNPELLVPAQRNLQYVLGRNYHGASCMAGVGWKWGAHFTFLCTCRGREEGIIPFAVNKGHAIGEQFFRQGMPYAVMPGAVSPLSMQEWNLEVYGVTQSMLLQALTSIAAALN